MVVTFMYKLVMLAGHSPNASKLTNGLSREDLGKTLRALQRISCKKLLSKCHKLCFHISEAFKCFLIMESPRKHHIFTTYRIVQVACGEKVQYTQPKGYP